MNTSTRFHRALQLDIKQIMSCNVPNSSSILATGVAQEAAYLDLRSKVCDTVATFASLIPVDGRQWLAATDYLSVYDVECNGVCERSRTGNQRPHH